MAIDVEQTRIVDGSITHLFVSEQILLDNWYTRHYRSKIVSPTQIVQSALILDGTNLGRKTGKHKVYVAQHMF